jgi:hypothetical protein
LYLQSLSRAGATAIGLATASALLAAAPAAAQQPPIQPTEAEASASLQAAEEALDSSATETAPEPTVALNQLAASLPVLQGAERRRAHGLLARPTDAHDRYGDSYPAPAPIASAESAHFCVFWVNDSKFDDAPNLGDSNGVADGDGIPDYVEEILEIAEYSYSIEVAPGPLGWKPPKRDKAGCGADPGARADVYLKQLGSQGLFGYESPDPGQGQKRSQHGYLVLDDDYSATEYGFFADPLAPAKVTFAHEFNHLLQQAYDSFQDIWMFEATAVWVEELVYPEINDYVNFVRSFALTPGAPITEVAAANGLKIYGTAVWNHWLDRGGGGYGPDAILRAWEVSDVAKPADFGISAYDEAIRDKGGRGFSREFVRFAAATAEWRTGDGGFPDGASYADMRRKGALRRGREARFELDHTGYRLFDVKPAGKLRLTVAVEDGVRAGIALVAREGDELTGTVKRKTRYLGKDGRGSVALTGAAGYERITAVVINADGREKGFAAGDWVYAKDNREFNLRLSG